MPLKLFRPYGFFDKEYDNKNFIKLTTITLPEITTKVTVLSGISKTLVH
jgi:hypothetical protein